ncbi:MAG: hypothetical protein ACLSH8_01900 [Zhenhengia sp.]|uniref:hypothetical protein n=1 Tax=Zhenhengia sp. TaxID=2944208 RepID=UPI00399476F2
MIYLTKCLFERFREHLLAERLGILYQSSVVQLAPNQFEFSFSCHPALFDELPELAEVCLMSDVDYFQVHLTIFNDSVKACCLAYPLEANDNLDSQLRFLAKLIELEFEEVYLPPYSLKCLGGTVL